MSQENEIKEALEKILGSSVTLRYDGSDPVDELKADFIKVIDMYESVWKRQNKLEDEMGLDFSTYDDSFFRVIEGFIHFCFEGVAAEAILFYVYSRRDDDGTLHPFVDSKEQEHMFDTIDDLWEFLLYWAEEMMKP